MEQKDIYVINVLSPQYYEDCHITGSINVPLDDIEAFVEDIDKDTPIIVYCASYECPASLNAWRKLNALGFSNIKAYEGGTNEWYHAGLPVEGPCQQAYLKVRVDRKGAKENEVKEISKQELYETMKKYDLTRD